MCVAAALELRDGDRGRLEALTRAPSLRAGLATRARIVLLAANPLADTAIANRTGTSRPTVCKYRGRYAESGVDEPDDDPRPGRAPLIDELALPAKTLADKVNAGSSWRDALVSAVDNRPTRDLVCLGGADLAQAGHLTAPRGNV